MIHDVLNIWEFSIPSCKFWLKPKTALKNKIDLKNCTRGNSHNRSHNNINNTSDIIATITNILLLTVSLLLPKCWHSLETQCPFYASVLFHFCSLYQECLLLLLPPPSSPPKKLLLIHSQVLEETSTPVWSCLQLSQVESGVCSLRLPLPPSSNWHSNSDLIAP